MPISGLAGDNIASRSANMPWYDGPDPDRAPGDGAARHAADQRARSACRCSWADRPNLDFRGFSGLVAAGTVRPGDPVRVLPSGRTTRVARIVTLDGDLAAAVAGQSVTLTLDDEVDCSRGDVIAAPTRRRKWPTSSRRPWSGWPTSRCCPAAPTC